MQSIITPLYIQQRQTPIDSDLVTSLVDSAYIQLRDRFQSDSNFVTNIVDTSYIQSKQLTFDFLDSGEVINLIDSSYVQARQTSGDGIDSAEAINLIDSSYVQARQTNFDASTVLPITGGTLAGNIRMSGNEINLAPTTHSDAIISFNEPGDNIVIRNHNTSGNQNNINIDTKSGSVQLRHVDTSIGLYHPMVDAKTNGSVDLYYDNSKKFETTTTGATVTGTLVATAFSGDGSNLTDVDASTVRVTESTDNNAGYNILFSNTTGSGNIQMTPIQDDGGLVFNPGLNVLYVQNLSVDNGNVLYGNGSTNRVGIGTTSPAKKLHIKDAIPDIRLEDTSTNAVVDLKGNTGTGSFVISTDVNNAIADSKIIFEVDGDEKARIDSGGNLGIGTTTPDDKLEVTRTSTDQTVGLTLTNEQAGGYGSGIVFKSKRTDTGTLLAAAEIRVQGENSWNGAGNVASQIQFASQRDGTLTDQMLLTKNGVLHTYGNELHINSGQGTVSHMNEFQFLTTEVTPTSSGSWLDVCFVSHSPCLRFHGMSIQGNNASYGGARFIGSVIGTYGSVVVNQEQKRVLGMNGGDVTDIDYRYLNSGAPSGSYRLQVKLSYTGGAHKVYTVVYGNATARIARDGT